MLLNRLVLAGLLGLSLPAAAKPVAELLPRFDQDVTALFERSKVPAAALAVVESGKVVYTRTLGVGSRAAPKPIDEHTIFRIASVSKTFAAVLAGQQLHEGRLHLSDPVRKYIPGFQLKYDRYNRLNLEHVLSHQGGLPHHSYDDLLEAGQPYPVLLRRLQTLAPACLVGRCYAYQNILYSTVGNALESVSGQSYAQLIQNRLFSPLGMRDSGVTLAHFQASKNRALPHIRTGRGFWPKAVDQPYYETQPASAVQTSIHDLGQYLIAVMGHRPDVLPPAVMAELGKPRVATPKEGLSSKWRRTRVKKPHYGLGWRIFQYDGQHTMLFHAGGQSGVSAMIGFLPGKDVGMAMLWNASDSKLSTLMPTLFDAVLDLPAVDYLERPKPAVKKAAAKKKPGKAGAARKRYGRTGIGTQASVKKKAASPVKKKTVSKKAATAKKKRKPAQKPTTRQPPG